MTRLNVGSMFWIQNYADRGGYLQDGWFFYTLSRRNKAKVPVFIVLSQISEQTAIISVSFE